MASVDAIEIALQRIEARCAEPKLKFFGIDQDLKALGDAIKLLRSDQRVIAQLVASMCELLAEAKTQSECALVLNGIDRNAVAVWSSTLRPIAYGGR